LDTAGWKNQPVALSGARAQGLRMSSSLTSHQPGRAIALKVAAIGLFTGLSAIIKATSDVVPAGEAVFFRSFFAIPVILVWLAMRKELGRGLRTAHPGKHFLRGLLGTTAMGMTFMGLGMLPLPEVTAIGYATPIFTLILAALLLKTGAYGLIRFVVPLFPEQSAVMAPWALWLGVLGIIYGAILAFAQTDLKRLVAYTSVSHMGFVLIGVYSWNELALQGTVMQMICHGLSTGALFMIVGMLYDRIHTRDVTRMGGLWTAAPQLGGVAMVFAMASLGLPGTGNFVGEFLVIFGVFKVNIAVTVAALLGIVAATVYSLRIIQTTFHGPAPTDWEISDLGSREMLMLTPMIIAIIWLGLWPSTVIATFEPALETLLHLVPTLWGGG